MIFSTEDIHNIRVENEKRRAKMSPIEAERDFKESVARSRAVLEQFRREMRDTEVREQRYPQQSL
ncbi:MAG: hypothetical protein LBT88_01440 [Oscillospiraceae bacterium]|jgi:anti-sigma-K factor RskA|nr:hypothetical protein [Oscillospiraceae bacterium]